MSRNSHSVSRDEFHAIVESAGYGAQMPTCKKERFILRAIVDRAYSVGVNRGMDSRQKIDKILDDFSND